MLYRVWPSLCAVTVSYVNFELNDELFRLNGRPRHGTDRRTRGFRLLQPCSYREARIIIIRLCLRRWFVPYCRQCRQRGGCRGTVSAT